MVGIGGDDSRLMGLLTRMWPAVAIAFTGFWFWSAANWTEPKIPEGWQGVDLELGASLGREASIQRHRDLIATVKDRASGGIRTSFCPKAHWDFGRRRSNGSGSGLFRARRFSWSPAPPSSMLRDMIMCLSRSLPTGQGPISRANAGPRLDVAAVAVAVW